MVEATKEVCRKCKYGKSFGNGCGDPYCDYLGMTGAMRARDETGKMCGNFESKKRKRKS